MRNVKDKLSRSLKVVTILALMVHVEDVAILAPLESFWSCLSITSDRALQTLQTQRLLCVGDERMSFCS